MLAPMTTSETWIPAGTFRMGSDAHYPEEAPRREVTLDGFWIDVHPVTRTASSRRSHARRAT
jgi:formylglycine-generating enzyme required for sulfatase activity